MSLEGKTILVTGAASGIGRAGATLFAGRGARVVMADIDEVGLAAAASEINASGGVAHAIIADLISPARAGEIVDEAVALCGGIDILWNNAGASGPRELEPLDLSLYAEALNLNLTAAIIASTKAISYMRARGGGSILFTSSTSGLVGSPQYAIYSATKFALVGFTKSLAQRVATDGIRVNAICAGPVRTPMLSRLAGNPSGPAAEEYFSRLVSAVPLGRPGEPIEIARAAYWLASDEASYVTGVALPVDGGYTCR